MINLCIIGAGEVVRDRYSRGLLTEGNASEFQVQWIYDVLPEYEVIETLKHFPKAKYRRIPLNVNEAVRQIEKEVEAKTTFIIATPTPLHIPYALELLKKFHFIAIEKPVTNSLDEFVSLESACIETGHSWFPLAYYLIEKALPFLVFMRKEFHVSQYLNLLEPNADPDQLVELRNDLGRPRKLVCCILEGGEATSGNLDRRGWVLTPEAGGNTWETLFHLSTLSTATLDLPLSTFKIIQSFRGIVEGVEHEDTSNLVDLEFEYLTAKIISSKYLDGESQQRWLRLICDGGEISLDFSTTAMLVETKSIRVQYQLIDPTPYAAQFSLLAQKINNPNMPLPLDIYRSALNLNDRIYKFTKSQVAVLYSRGSSIEKVVAKTSNGNSVFPLSLARQIPRI